MERKITKLEHSHVEVLVTVDEKSWKDAQKKAFDKQAANITVPGFRKGKAPEAMVKARVDQGKVLDDAINAILPVAYREILDEEKIVPQAQPAVSVSKVTLDELEIKFDFVVAPEVKLGAYKGLEIGHESVEVKDEDVDNAVNDLLKNNASLILKEGESALGDTVVIDFVGTIDGVAFEGGTAQNYELELGSHSFIPGFEEQLVNHKAGDHVDVNVKFPENYVDELKGKDAVFACDIHEVKEKKLPELNDEFVKELKIPNVETIAQLRENKLNELKNRKAEEEKNRYLNKLLDKIVEGSTCDVANEIIDSEIKGRKADLEKRMAQSGLTLEQYLQIIGQSAEEFDAQLRKDAGRDIARFFVLEEVRKVENISVSLEEVEFEMAKLAEQYGMKVEDVKKTLANQMDRYQADLINRKVEQFLVDNNK